MAALLVFVKSAVARGISIHTPLSLPLWLPPHSPLSLTWSLLSCDPPGPQERVKQAPCPTQVAAALDFLAGTGIGEGADLGAVVTTFPEALGLRVELMQENVQVGRRAGMEGGWGSRLA